MVTLHFGEVPAANVLVAQRPYLKAAACAGKGEFPKGTSLYRRVLELDPTRQDASRELAMVLLETGIPDDAIDTLLDVLKDPHPAQEKSVNTTNIWQLRDRFKEAAAQKHDPDVAKDTPFVFTPRCDHCGNCHARFEESGGGGDVPSDLPPRPRAAACWQRFQKSQVSVQDSSKMRTAPVQFPRGKRRAWPALSGLEYTRTFVLPGSL